MDTRNHEHYKDRTAHDAIKAADKPPDSVTRTINAMKAVAAIDEFEVFGRIKLRDKKTGKIYRWQERGDSIGKVSPDPVLRYASRNKRAEEAHKNDRRKAGKNRARRSGERCSKRWHGRNTAFYS